MGASPEALAAQAQLDRRRHELDTERRARNARRKIAQLRSLRERCASFAEILTWQCRGIFDVRPALLAALRQLPEGETKERGAIKVLASCRFAVARTMLSVIAYADLGKGRAGVRVSHREWASHLGCDDATSWRNVSLLERLGVLQIAHDGRACNPYSYQPKGGGAARTWSHLSARNLYTLTSLGLRVVRRFADMLPGARAVAGGAAGAAAASTPQACAPPDAGAHGGQEGYMSPPTQNPAKKDPPHPMEAVVDAAVLERALAGLVVGEAIDVAKLVEKLVTDAPEGARDLGLRRAELTARSLFQDPRSYRGARSLGREGDSPRGARKRSGLARAGGALQALLEDLPASAHAAVTSGAAGFEAVAFRGVPAETAVETPPNRANLASEPGSDGEG